MSGFFKFFLSRKARIFLGLLVFCAAFPAMAQSDRDIVNRLNRLENEIDTMGRAVYKGEKPPPGHFTGGGGGVSAADTEIRIQQLEGELRSLTGRIEEQDYQIKQIKEQTERLTADIDLRLADLEKRGGGSPPVSSPVYNSPPMQNDGGGFSPLAAPEHAQGGYSWDSGVSYGGSRQPEETAPPVSSPGGSADAAALYENAFSLLKAAQYDAAGREFSDFLSRYPDHPLASNAQYWLGESHYVRGDFEKASRVFAEGYKKYPAGPKAADNLLKLAMSLAGQGKIADACVALRQVEKDYAAGADPVIRRAKQEMTRLGC